MWSCLGLLYIVYVTNVKRPLQRLRIARAQIPAEISFFVNAAINMLELLKSGLNGRRTEKTESVPTRTVAVVD